MVPLVSLYFASGDICSGFQSQCGSPKQYLRYLSTDPYFHVLPGLGSGFSVAGAPTLQGKRQHKILPNLPKQIA